MSFTDPRAVHIDSLLTNLSVAYLGQTKAISPFIFPRMPVKKQSDVFRIYPKSTFYRANAKVRAPGTETPGINMQFTLGNYYAKTWGLHIDIDDDTRANADDDLNLDSNATRLLTQAMVATRELQFASSYLKAGVWGADLQPATKWSAAGSDPVQDVTAAINEFIVANGFAPNVAVVGLNVHQKLKTNANIIDRVKYTNDGSVTTDMLKNLFELDGQYIVADGVVSPDVAAILPPSAVGTYGSPDDVQLQLVCPDIFGLFYVPPSPGLLTPAPGYSFNWTNRVGGANDISISNFRLNKIKSDRIESEMAFDQRQVCPSLGALFSNVI